MMLHRGLSFPSHSVDRIADELRSGGLVAGAGKWRMLFPDLKPRLKALRDQHELRYSDVHDGEETPPWVCACARRVDALYYACRHNRSDREDASLVVSFEAPLRDVIIDGRDFLYPSFQFGVPERAGPALVEIYGAAILPYAERAWSSPVQSFRILCCDLAIQDDEVVSAHSRNTTVLGGKQRTVFASAFMARAPILPENIKGVDVVNAVDFAAPAIELNFRSITTFER